MGCQGDDLSPKERSGIAILRIQSHIGFIPLRLKRTLDDDQTLWDGFCPVFDEIVNLAAEVVRHEAGVPYFCLDLGIIGPVFEFVSRCRDPIIRRKAIAVLKSTSRQEGVWNSFLTAKVAERLVGIEERGLGKVRCCNDVPGWARINKIQPQFDAFGRRVTVEYTRFRSQGILEREIFEEVIEW